MSEHGITPKGHRLLILPEQVEETTASGIVRVTGTEKLREELAQVDGVVIEMGQTCFINEPRPWCKVGDTVIFAKYAGIMYKGKDGKTYRIINDDNIVATTTERNIK